MLTKIAQNGNLATHKASLAKLGGQIAACPPGCNTFHLSFAQTSFPNFPSATNVIDMGSTRGIFAFLIFIQGVRTFAKKEVKAFINYLSPGYAPFWWIVYDALTESLIWGGVADMNPLSWGPWSTAWIPLIRLVHLAISCYEGTKNGWLSEDRMNVAGHCFAVKLHCLVMFALWRKHQKSKRRYTEPNLPVFVTNSFIGERRVCTEPEVEKTHHFPQETSEDKEGLVASDLNEKGSLRDQTF